MGTQLIFTVGTNPLPIWVAWHHLKDKLQPPVQVRFVHTAGTKNEKDRLESYCQDADFPQCTRSAIRSKRSEG